MDTMDFALEYLVHILLICRKDFHPRNLLYTREHFLGENIFLYMPNARTSIHINKIWTSYSNAK